MTPPAFGRRRVGHSTVMLFDQTPAGRPMPNPRVILAMESDDPENPGWAGWQSFAADELDALIQTLQEARCWLRNGPARVACDEAKRRAAAYMEPRERDVAPDAWGIS